METLSWIFPLAISAKMTFSDVSRSPLKVYPTMMISTSEKLRNVKRVLWHYGIARQDTHCYTMLL